MEEIEEGPFFLAVESELCGDPLGSLWRAAAELNVPTDADWCGDEGLQKSTSEGRARRGKIV